MKTFVLPIDLELYTALKHLAALLCPTSNSQKSGCAPAPIAHTELGCVGRTRLLSDSH